MGDIAEIHRGGTGLANETFRRLRLDLMKRIEIRRR